MKYVVTKCSRLPFHI